MCVRTGVDCNVQKKKKKKVLGKGSFGTVHGCRSRVDGCLYAVKHIPMFRHSSMSRQSLLREGYVMSALSRMGGNGHHLAQYYFMWEPPARDSLYIVMEWCSNGSLASRLGTPQSAHTLGLVALHIGRALHFLHSRAFVHLDVKPENILITRDNQFKLADFGLCVHVDKSFLVSTAEPKRISSPVVPRTGPVPMEQEEDENLNEGYEEYVEEEEEEEEEEGEIGEECDNNDGNNNGYNGGLTRQRTMICDDDKENDVSDFKEKEIQFNSKTGFDMETSPHLSNPDKNFASERNRKTSTTPMNAHLHCVMNANAWIETDDNKEYGIDKDIDNLQTLKTFSIQEGDRRYLCRELLEGTTHISQLHKVDIFALGASIYEMLTMKRLPHSGTAWYRIRSGFLEFENVNSQLQHLVQVEIYLIFFFFFLQKNKTKQKNVCILNFVRHLEDNMIEASYRQIQSLQKQLNVTHRQLQQYQGDMHAIPSEDNALTTPANSMVQTQMPTIFASSVSTTFQGSNKTKTNCCEPFDADMNTPIRNLFM
ncbi:hypothetical protein RFI_04468 [Reticulomyxa filosa]|uniref:Protein kinase domain-containing protein n=1 Tax=Reticulomyxa filosa TaxID=46433 RepID=X6P3I5_RETFI|nr:hypothetical protein RFI_04468 [Reticulomyxa filosa]|eukprot:ETO32649.1 hypothetical protein RFI_04468 [Reticulomyxa filosa]